MDNLTKTIDYVIGQRKMYPGKTPPLNRPTVHPPPPPPVNPRKKYLPSSMGLLWKHTYSLFILNKLIDTHNKIVNIDIAGRINARGKARIGSGSWG